MGRKRFTRDALISSEASISKAVYKKYTTPSNEARLEATLGLVDVSDEKPTIDGIMTSIMERYEEEERIKSIRLAQSWAKRGWPNSMIYDCMGEEDYPVDIEGLTAKEIKKLNKRLYGKNKSNSYSEKKGKKRGRPSKKSLIMEDSDDFWENRDTMFRHGEWSEDLEEEGYESGYKKINFYPDITNEMSVVEFDSLKEFNDYCSEHGYVVGETDYSNLKNWSVIHCCLDPIDKEYGDYAIITDTSYGGLYWTVEPDLPADVKESENKYALDGSL